MIAEATPSAARTGDWITTFSGVKWFITNPHPGDVRIEDIAHGLSLICRYGGQCREFYSVAQHSLIVASEVKKNSSNQVLVMHGLLHDATEAYVGDMVRPLKMAMPKYKLIEHITAGVIAAALNLPPLTLEQRAIIKYFDDVALMTERRDLVNHCGHEWTPRAEPRPEPIVPMSPEEAESGFLLAYHSLRASAPLRDS